MASLLCMQCGKVIDPRGRYGKLNEGDFFKDYQPICDNCIRGYEARREKRGCTLCAYHKRMPSTEPVGPSALPSDVYCGKIGMLIPPTHLIFLEGPYEKFYFDLLFYLNAEKCVHFTSEEEYLEKAMRGEVETVKETHFVVCEYCSCRYDMNQHHKCPQCGGPNT